MTWAYTIETDTMETQPLQETACWETTTTAENRVELCYNWNRYYDPVMGMYTSPDSIVEISGGFYLRATASLPQVHGSYIYAGFTPTRYTDLNGLASCHYSISNRVLTCRPNDKRFVGPPVGAGPENVFSGQKEGFNNPGASDKRMIGPVPPESYNIYPNQDPDKQGWWWLQRKSWSKFDGLLYGFGYGRAGFNIHLGGFSQGCITVDKEHGNSEDQFNNISDLLRSEMDFGNDILVVP